MNLSLTVSPSFMAFKIMSFRALIVTTVLLWPSEAMPYLDQSKISKATKVRAIEAEYFHSGIDKYNQQIYERNYKAAQKTANHLLPSALLKDQASLIFYFLFKAYLLDQNYDRALRFMELYEVHRPNIYEVLDVKAKKSEALKAIQKGEIDLGPGIIDGGNWLKLPNVKKIAYIKHLINIFRKWGVKIHLTPEEYVDIVNAHFKMHGTLSSMKYTFSNAVYENEPSAVEAVVQYSNDIQNANEIKSRLLTSKSQSTYKYIYKYK